MTDKSLKMTVNYNFDLEDDDLFDSFLSNCEYDVLTSTAVQKVNDQDLKKTSTENQLKENNLQKSHSILPKTLDIKVKDKGTGQLNEQQIVTYANKSTESVKQENLSLILSPIQDSSKDTLNSRFVPGFTPKPKKRKFPGPAGIYTQQNNIQILSPEKSSSAESFEKNLETQDISNSQSTTDDLLLPSWQNLQKDVSSCQTLLSTAKHHSIQRVLNETSKKKLPKHIVVPVLCVLIKKFKPEDSSLLLIDDTGEISGKVYKDVLEEYKEHIKVGTALILKKVTCLCNVLLLKKPCMASIYLRDGSVKHIHELSTLLNKDEPLKQMGCECPGTPKANADEINTILKMCDASLDAASTSKNAAGCSASSAKSKVLNPSNHILPIGNNSPSFELYSKRHLSNVVASRKDSIQLNKSGGKQLTSAFCSNSSNGGIDSLPKDTSSSIANENESVAMPLLKDPFYDDNEMDEFDELLCSLDEKSFLAEA